MENRTLSPSRAGDFKRCPQLFKYRAIDKRKEPQSPAAGLGNLVHSALEQLMKLPDFDRVPHSAHDMLDNLATLTGEPWSGLGSDLIAKAHSFVDNYFALEDPRTVRPIELEWWVEMDLGSGVTFRGIIDRLDEDRSIVDYKTGRPPSERYEKAAFFGLRFYAAACRRTHGFVPKQIKLLYLASKEQISLVPDAQMLDAFEKQLMALDRAISKALERDDFRPRPSQLCKHCHFIDECPAWEGVENPWKT